MSIAENLKEVQRDINEVCKKCGRDPSEVTLIAVSKTKPLEDLKEAYDAGARDFGENKVQELTAKMPNLPSDIRWHMIGHLQRNEVKYIAGEVELIHSVDSFRLAEEINIQAKRKKIIIPALIEINIGDEESKFGVRPDEAMELCKEISELDSIHIEGLMTVAPAADDPEEVRRYFRKMHELFLDIKSENIDNVEMKILSMGMTND